MTILLKVVGSAVAPLAILFAMLPHAQANNYIENKQVVRTKVTPKPTNTSRGNTVSRSMNRAPLIVNPSSKVAIHANQYYAKSYMSANYNWNQTQYSCVVKLWNRESGWRANAHNSSGAHGIPQALPGRKMAKFGKDWYTNPQTQIKWGLHYIKARYGTPCGALNHSYRYNWY